jgi:hypothetical protein
MPILNLPPWLVLKRRRKLKQLKVYTIVG